jgi:hypothetical protein
LNCPAERREDDEHDRHEVEGEQRVAETVCRPGVGFVQIAQRLDDALSRGLLRGHALAALSVDARAVPTTDLWRDAFQAVRWLFRRVFAAVSG